MVTNPQPGRLADIVAALRRRWTVIAAAAVVGLVLGVLTSFAVPSKYQATSTVSVNPMSSDPVEESAPGVRSISMSTEAGIATSAQVAASATKALRPDHRISADQIRDAVEVTSPADSLLLDIRFTGDSAEEAAAGAEAVARAYLAIRRADAKAEVDRVVASTQEKLVTVQASADSPDNAGPLQQRALTVQAEALGTKLAQISSMDLDPGRIVGSAEVPDSPSTPGALPLGLAGLIIGLLAGIPVALLKKGDTSRIGGAEGLHAIGDQIVLDGTRDNNRADTWDIAAFMLKIPADLGEDPFLIMVDAENEEGRTVTAGQELVDALSRRGNPARFVDAGAVNEGKISRGWPTDAKRSSWAGEIVVIDTTHLSSDANKVALATRSDSVLLARSTTDDASALRRLAGLLKSKSVDVALTALFPARSELVMLNR